MKKNQYSIVTNSNVCFNIKYCNINVIKRG